MEKEKKNILKKRHDEFLHNQELLKMVEIGELNEAKRLIDEGATLHKLSGSLLHLYTRNSEYETLLHVAVKLGHFDIVAFLIKSGCDINLQTRRCKASPLHYATYPNVSPEILKLLLKNNAIIEIEDDDQATPFMWACYLNNSNAVQILIEEKANYLCRDSFGLTPLEWACHQGNLNSVLILINKIDYTNRQIESARQYAMESGQMQLTDILNNKLVL